MPRTDPLPVEAVRDLLGIARAVFAARKRGLATEPELAELADIGRMLKNALKLAKSSPDSLGHRSAWQQAEEACSRLMRIIGMQVLAASVVEAAVVRIRRLPSRPAGEREQKRAAAKIRS